MWASTRKRTRSSAPSKHRLRHGLGLRRLVARSARARPEITSPRRSGKTAVEQSPCLRLELLILRFPIGIERRLEDAFQFGACCLGPARLRHQLGEKEVRRGAVLVV